MPDAAARSGASLVAAVGGKPSLEGDLRSRKTLLVSTREQLVRISTVDALASAIRGRIFEGDPAPGDRRPERELTERYGVARHSVRAALRALAAEGLVVIEPHRGASVARLDADGIRSLFELRTALELEAAHLALERHGNRLPEAVHQAVRRLREVCSTTNTPWSAVALVAADVTRVAGGAPPGG